MKPGQRFYVRVVGECADPCEVTVVTGNVMSRRWEGIGAFEPHVYVDSGYSRYWAPVAGLYVDPVVIKPETGQNICEAA